MERAAAESARSAKDAEVRTFLTDARKNLTRFLGNASSPERAVLSDLQPIQGSQQIGDLGQSAGFPESVREHRGDDGEEIPFHASGPSAAGARFLSLGCNPRTPANADNSVSHKALQGRDSTLDRDAVSSVALTGLNLIPLDSGRLFPGLHPGLRNPAPLALDAFGLRWSFMSQGSSGLVMDHLGCGNLQRIQGSQQMVGLGQSVGLPESAGEQ